MEHTKVRHIRGGIATKLKYEKEMSEAMIIYFRDNTFYLVYKDKIIESTSKDCVKKGFLINKDLFIIEFTHMLKKERIKSKLFGSDITILKNSFYRESDCAFLENIFIELGFNKVLFMDMKDVLTDESATYIEINQSYFVVYLEDALYFDIKYFKDIPKILEYLKDNFKDYVILFGSSSLIPHIKVNGVVIYYLENPALSVLNSLLKVKKCDV